MSLQKKRVLWSPSASASRASVKKEASPQVELAALLGVSQPVVSEYERGGFALKAEQLSLLARLLRVSADELLGLKADASPRRGPRDSRLARLLRDVEALPRRDKDALLRTIEAFVRAREKAA